MSVSKNNWDFHVEKMDKHHFGGKQIEEVINRLTTQAWYNNSLQILDFGCGTGRFARELVQKGAESVHGVDVESKMIEFAKAKVEESGYQDRISLQHLEKLDASELDADKYDCVVSLTVFGHVRGGDYSEVFANVVKSLKVGGYLVISEFKNFDHSIFHDPIFAEDHMQEHATKIQEGHHAHDHVSDGGHHHTQFNEEIWTQLAQDNNMEVVCLEEYFNNKLNFFIAKRNQWISIRTSSRNQFQ